MTKAILTTKVSPTYDDLPEVRYHFPASYLNQVSAAKGDWIVYYEPRRSTGELSSSGGRQAYFATAKITDITQDMSRPGHYYAHLESYLEFTRPVPFKEGLRYYENGLRKEDGSTNKGAFGRAVRPLSDSEYDAIWQAGFAHVIGAAPRERLAPDVPEEPQALEVEFASDFFGADVPMTQERKIVSQLVSRPFRDKAFAAAVKSAYRDTCAMTGLKLINGGGRSEVQAAHIRPVEHRGPDSVRNGIALSGTMHWMFDRGLVSVDEDYRLLFARQGVPDTLERLIGGNTHLLPTLRADQRPHAQFLQWHRESVFKG